MKIQNPPSLPLPFVHSAPIGLPLVLGEVFFMNEIWKDIPNLIGFQASNIGNIKRSDVPMFNKSTFVNPYFSSKGYLRMCINKKTYAVHRLVAMAFIPNPLNKPQINHKNGIKSDNRIENLEWVTGSENIQHAIKAGLFNINYKNLIFTKPKLSYKQVIEIRGKYENRKNVKCTLVSLGKEYGVSYNTISCIIHRKWLYTQGKERVNG